MSSSSIITNETLALRNPLPQILQVMVAPALSKIEGGRREDGCLHPAVTSADLSSQSPEHRTVTYEP